MLEVIDLDCLKVSVKVWDKFKIYFSSLRTYGEREYFIIFVNNWKKDILLQYQYGKFNNENAWQFFMVYFRWSFYGN